jgi:hypothetical protein
MPVSNSQWEKMDTIRNDKQLYFDFLLDNPHQAFTAEEIYIRSSNQTMATEEKIQRMGESVEGFDDMLNTYTTLLSEKIWEEIGINAIRVYLNILVDEGRVERRVDEGDNEIYYKAK